MNEARGVNPLDAFLHRWAHVLVRLTFESVPLRGHRPFAAEANSPVLFLVRHRNGPVDPHVVRAALPEVAHVLDPSASTGSATPVESASSTAEAPGRRADQRALATLLREGNDVVVFDDDDDALKAVADALEDVGRPAGPRAGAHDRSRPGMPTPVSGGGEEPRAEGEEPRAEGEEPRGDGATVAVVPLELYYSAPHRLRSRAEVYVGEAVEDSAVTVDVLRSALDAASIPDPASADVEAVRAAAVDDAKHDDRPFALAMRERARQAAAGRPLPEPRRSEMPLLDIPYEFTRGRFARIVQLWLFLPVVIAGWLTGLLVRKTGVGGGPGLGSGANLGSRKHLGGGSGAGTRSVTWVQWRVCVLVLTAWVPCVVFAAFRWPVEVAIGLCMAGLGLWLLTAREHRP